MGLRVFGWWAGAALAIYRAFWKERMHVVTSVLKIMPIVRVASYQWGWITYLVSDPRPITPSRAIHRRWRGMSAALAWDNEDFPVGHGTWTTPPQHRRSSS